LERQHRIALIKELEDYLGSRIICYLTGDRENVNTRVAPDIIRVFYHHLETIGPQSKIHLFLYTRGGDVLTPWRLVNLIREYTSFFGVIIPYRAYSAGTLICLGADELVMGRMGELGPIDPSVANAFNPQDPNNPIARIPVSVEDVSSYLALVKEKGGLNSDNQILAAFRLLSERVHPLALGNVHRNHALIRSLARKLLTQRSFFLPETVIQEIIDNLTEKLYAHNYMISRREAKQSIKLPVSVLPPMIEKCVWQLFEGYESCLCLHETFNPEAILPDQEREINFKVIGGIIESMDRTDGFIFSGKINRTCSNAEGNPNVMVNMLGQSWQKLYERGCTCRGL
jgi:hypothetical protein